MTIYNVACLIVTSVVVGWAFRPRWTLEWFGLTAVPLLGIPLALIWRGGQVSYGPPGPTDLVFLVFFASLWYFLSPTGDQLIARLRAARSSRFQFDRRLHRTIEPLGRLLYAGPKDGDADGRARSVSIEGDEALSRLQQLAPPTPEWAEVRAEYMSLMRGSGGRRDSWRRSMAIERAQLAISRDLEPGR